MRLSTSGGDLERQAVYFRPRLGGMYCVGLLVLNDDAVPVCTVGEHTFNVRALSEPRARVPRGPYRAPRLQSTAESEVVTVMARDVSFQCVAHSTADSRSSGADVWALGIGEGGDFVAGAHAQDAEGKQAPHARWWDAQQELREQARERSLAPP